MVADMLDPPESAEEDGQSLSDSFGKERDSAALDDDNGGLPPPL
jgi:hypothetical protein